MANSRVRYPSLAEEFEDLDGEFQKLQSEHRKYKEKLKEVKDLQAKCSTLLKHQQKKYRELQETIAGTGHGQNSEDSNMCKELANQIKKKQKLCNEMQSSLPKQNGFLLNTMIGKVSVSLLTQSEKFDYKESYERFKLYTTIVMLVYSLVNIFIVQYRVCDAIYHFMIVWYYCTLVLRENILVHNGSRIKMWWLMHHYLTVVLTGILLIWPDSPSYQMFRNQFMAFGVYLNFLQLLQYYYQSGCLYRLRALGQKSDMDVTVEGFQNWMWKGLTFLLPFLFFGYLFQFYNAITLYRISQHPDCNEWMVPVAAFIFFILFLGNSGTLSKVVLDKIIRGDKSKRS